MQIFKTRAEGDPGYVYPYSGPTSFKSELYPRPARQDPAEAAFRQQALTDASGLSLVSFEDLLLEQMEG